MTEEIKTEVVKSYSAFGANGKQIFLPRNGRVLLPAGSFVLSDGQWTTLERDMYLIKETRQEEYRTYSYDRLIPAGAEVV